MLEDIALTRVLPHMKVVAGEARVAGSMGSLKVAVLDRLMGRSRWYCLNVASISEAALSSGSVSGSLGLPTEKPILFKAYFTGAGFETTKSAFINGRRSR